MVEEQTSAFLKKYKQILNFKTQVKKRVSSDSNNNHLIHNDNSNKNIKIKNMNILPKLNPMKKNPSSQKYTKEEQQKNNSIIIKKNQDNKNYISVNNTGKEYRNLIKIPVRLYNDDFFTDIEILINESSFNFYQIDIIRWGKDEKTKRSQWYRT